MCAAAGRSISRATPPGTMASIISRWPKQVSAARNVRSRKIPQCACIMRKRGVVADGADVAEMIGQALELGHQRAQIDRARRDLHLQRGFRGLREGKGIGHRAVAGGAPGQLRRVVERGAGAQLLDALVHIAEPLLQPHDMFAIGGETEMSGLDDAGMHRADRDLMQAFALGWQEFVCFGLALRFQTP